MDIKNPNELKHYSKLIDKLTSALNLSKQNDAFDKFKQILEGERIDNKTLFNFHALINLSPIEFIRDSF